MNFTLRYAALGMVASLAAVSASAANWGKPGLWQTTSTMQMSMGGMPTISSAQMAQMKRMGMKMPTMGGQSIDAKVCLSPSDAATFSAERYSQQKSGCKQASVVRLGNHITSRVVCNGQMKGNGQADVTLADDRHYSTVFAFKGTSHGRPVDMKVSTSARWLDGKCGTIKPFHPG